MGLASEACRDSREERLAGTNLENLQSPPYGGGHYKQFSFLSGSCLQYPLLIECFFIDSKTHINMVHCEFHAMGGKSLDFIDCFFT